MFKRVMIVGSLVVGIAAMLGSEAIAGCIPGTSPLWCASWYKGSVIGKNICGVGDVESKGCTPTSYNEDGSIKDFGTCPTTTYGMRGTVDANGTPGCDPNIQECFIPVFVTCWQKKCEKNPSSPQCGVEHQTTSAFLAGGVFSETDTDSACLKKNCRVSKTSATFFAADGSDLASACAAGHVVKDATVAEFRGTVTCCQKGIFNGTDCSADDGPNAFYTTLEEKCSGGQLLQIGDQYICVAVE